MRESARIKNNTLKKSLLSHFDADFFLALAFQLEGGRFAQVHEKHRLNLPVIQQFIDSSPEFQLKVVVSDERANGTKRK